MKRRRFFEALAASAAFTGLSSIQIIPEKADNSNSINGAAFAKGVEESEEKNAVESSASASSDSSNWIIVDEPFEGAVFHPRSPKPMIGIVTNAKQQTGCQILVQGHLPIDFPANATVLVNGQTSARSENRFTCPIELYERKNEIVVQVQTGQRIEKKVVRVAWIKESFPRYRFQVDDNSFFLRDICKNQYKSLFDCFYLAMYRDLHLKYGSKFTLNVFNSTPERDFQLSDFPETYKSEWEDNSDWLRLAFHAENEFPDRPYETAKPEKLAADFDEVAGQIRRFAGKAYRQPGIIHWGTIRPEAYKTLYDRGVRTLSGYFTKSGNSWVVSFQLPDSVCQYLTSHEAWMNFDENIMFSRLEMVVNSTPIDKIIPILDASRSNPNFSEVVDFLTHEQYFWPSYQSYLPDHAKRMDRAIRWVTENGYKPVFLDDGFYGTGVE